MNHAEALAAMLRDELGDRDDARDLAAALVEDALTWRTPEIAPERIRLIIAYTFGNRMLDNGNRRPGPVNEALAEIAVDLHRRTAAPVFAQWEVAEAIAGRIAPGRLTAINPGRDAMAEPVYLSTGGVAAAVASLVGDPRAAGPVAVVAFRDHAKRSVDTTRRAGFDAYVAAGTALPSTYDAQSGQPWTRSRLAYLLHDIRARVSDRRDDLLRDRPENAR